MIRGGTFLGRIACSLALGAAGLALAIPAAAGAQSAVDEYTLEIPKSGNQNPGSGGDPGVGASGSGSGGNGGGGSAGSGGSGGGSASESSEGEGRSADREALGLGSLGEGGTGSVDPGSRSAPAVVADALVDSAMLPVLAALFLITGLGAWRVLRGRGMLIR